MEQNNILFRSLTRINMFVFLQQPKTRKFLCLKCKQNAKVTQKMFEKYIYNYSHLYYPNIVTKFENSRV